MCATGAQAIDDEEELGGSRRRVLSAPRRASLRLEEVPIQVKQKNQEDQRLRAMKQATQEELK